MIQYNVFSIIFNVDAEVVLLDNIEKCRSYPDYLIKSFKATQFGGVFAKIASFFRKSLLITRILRAIWLFLSYIQTGAFFLIAFSFLIVLLPALLIFALFVSAVNFFRFGKQNKFFKKLLEDKECEVYFVTDDHVMPENGNETIRIVVHPFRFFKTDRKGKTDYHIGMPYFFSLKRNVLRGKNVIYFNLREKDNTSGPLRQ